MYHGGGFPPRFGAQVLELLPNALAKEDVPLAERPAGARAEFALQLLRVLQDELGVLHRLLLGTSQLLERRDKPVPRVERLETHPMGISCNLPDF